MHPDKQKKILALSAEERYFYFIRKIADFEEVWLIHSNGHYVTLDNKEEQTAIPVWPEKEFAELMLTDSWKEYMVDSMKVHDFLEWLDIVELEGYQMIGFPTVDMKAIMVTASEMKDHVIFELQKYE